MGDKKDNLLLNEQALSDEELNTVTAGFSLPGFFSAIAAFFGKKSAPTPSNVPPVIAGLTRPQRNDDGLDGYNH